VSQADTTVDDADENETLASCWNLIAEGSLHPRVMLPRFLEYNSKVLARETKGRQLFAPEWLGGLGLTAPVGSRLRWTSSQIQLAKKNLSRAYACKDTHRIVPIVGPHPRGCRPFDSTDTIKHHWSLPALVTSKPDKSALRRGAGPILPTPRCVKPWLHTRLVLQRGRGGPPSDSVATAEGQPRKMPKTVAFLPKISVPIHTNPCIVNKRSRFVASVFHFNEPSSIFTNWAISTNFGTTSYYSFCLPGSVV
jgi:hypothetical protein